MPPFIFYIFKIFLSIMLKTKKLAITVERFGSYKVIIIDAGPGIDKNPIPKSRFFFVKL